MGADVWQQKLSAVIHFASRQKAFLVGLFKRRRTPMTRWLGRTNTVRNKRVSTWQDGTTNSTTLRIYNKGRSVVEAFWVKYDGDLQQYGTIKPGGMLPISSFNTHVWCLRDAGASAVLTIQPGGQLHVRLLAPDNPDDNVDDSSWMRPEWGQYRQHGTVLGLPIMAYDCVGKAAVDELACCITHMMATVDPAVLERVQQAGCKLAIIGKDQVTSDIPPHHFMKCQASEGGRDIDATTRGLGATRAVPTTSCGEENITMTSDKCYPEESILVHEFAHAVMNVGFDDSQVAEIQMLYKQAQQKGIYKADCYMMDNAEEYWAEGSQVWFGATVRTDVTSGINTRKLLQQHDPGLCRLILKVYGPNTWQYTDTCPGTFTTPSLQRRQLRQQQRRHPNKPPKQQRSAAGTDRHSLRSHKHLTMEQQHQLPTKKKKAQQEDQQVKPVL